MEVWKQVGNFKIRRKTDVQYFLENVLTKGCDYMIKVDYDYLLKISVDENGSYEIGEKRGEIYDLFNPILILPHDKIIDTLWKCRKAINKKFFSDEQ